MRVFLDGDASPVTRETISACKLYSIKLIVVKNFNNQMSVDYGELVSVDNHREAADLYIVNNLNAGDIVITADYGLASLALSRKAHVITFNGQIVDNNNIEIFLGLRAVSAKQRRDKKIYTKFKKRLSSDNEVFYSNLVNLLKSLI